MKLKYYHNPRCRKSRETLQYLKELGYEPELILYLKNPPTFEELKDVIGKLGIKPLELIRKNESIYKEKYKGKEYSDDEWIRIMIENPKLIERPIIISESKAVIGRPKEKVHEIIGK